MATLSKGPILLGCPQASPRPAREPRSWLERESGAGPALPPRRDARCPQPARSPSFSRGERARPRRGDTGGGKGRVSSTHTHGKGIALFLEVLAMATPRTRFLPPWRAALRHGPVDPTGLTRPCRSAVAPPGGLGEAHVPGTALVTAKGYCWSHVVWGLGQGSFVWGWFVWFSFPPCKEGVHQLPGGAETTNHCQPKSWRLVSGPDGRVCLHAIARRSTQMEGKRREGPDRISLMPPFWR